MHIDLTFVTGCYISLGNVEKAQEYLDEIPNLVDKRKVGGKDLPTEVVIKKKCALCSHVINGGTTSLNLIQCNSTGRSNDVGEEMRNCTLSVSRSVPLKVSRHRTTVT